MSLNSQFFCPISYTEHIESLPKLSLEAQTAAVKIALESAVNMPEVEQMRIVEPMTNIVLEQVIRLYEATPAIQRAFPVDKYKLTLFEKLDIYNLIRMYENSGQSFETKQKQKHTIQNAIQTNLIKTSLPQKLERIDWDFGRLKDLIRFTIEKDNFGTIEDLVQDSIKLTDILTTLGYETYDVDAKYDEGTGYSDITLQFINKSQPTALNPKGTIIEVKFQSKAGMIAKKLEDPVYHKRRFLAEEIRLATRTEFRFAEFIGILNTHFGALIDKNKGLSNSNLNGFLLKTDQNSHFEKSKILLTKYYQLLKESKSILKNVPAVVNSKQAANAFELLFKFQNSPEGRFVAEQNRLKAQRELYNQQLISLRDVINSSRL